MKWTFAILALLAVTVATVSAVQKARADIFSVSPGEPSLGASYAEFTWNEDDNTTTIHIHIEGITTNPDADHGIHVHTYGDLSAVNGTSFGGHWDPEGKDHGCVGSEHSAAGDLGNWTAVGGIIDDTRNYTNLPLSGALSIVGRGIVLHEAPDNCAVASSAKTRLAGGVIGVKNIAGNTASPNPSFGNGPFLAVCVLSQTTNGKLWDLNGTFYWSQSSASAGVTAAGYIGYAAKAGVHIHAWGDLSAADGTATGGHYDPAGTGIHAYPTNSTAHHAGDMGNTDPTQLVNNVMWYHNTFPAGYMTISGSTASIVGRGFIVHNGTDDGVSQPTGNAGARNGQCVIGIANSTLTAVRTYTPPTPSPGNGAAGLTFSLAVLLAVALIALFQ